MKSRRILMWTLMVLPATLCGILPGCVEKAILQSVTPFLLS